MEEPLTGFEDASGLPPRQCSGASSLALHGRWTQRHPAGGRSHSTQHTHDLPHRSNAQVLPPSASQADVYAAAVRPIVEDVLAGYNGTVMAYGQTGAGKTHTLSSVAPETIGAVPRAAAEVFAGVQRGGEDVHAVYMSYVQIYMELIQDLLAPESENLQIREGEAGVFIAGVRQVEVRRLEDCLELLQAGDRNRC